MVRKALSAADDSPNDEPEDVLVSSAEEFTADSESFRKKVAEAAYLKAEQRGFESGYELEDWLQAEQEVKAELEAERSGVDE